MTSTNDIIVGWFGDIEPENETQKKIMFLFGTLFESYHTDDNLEMTIEYASNAIDPVLSPEALFSPAALSNKEMFSKIHEQLNGMKMKPDPELPHNARYAFKVAHIMYPGDAFKAKRDIATKGIRNHLSELRRLKDIGRSHQYQPMPSSAGSPQISSRATSSEPSITENTISVVTRAVVAQLRSMGIHDNTRSNSMPRETRTRRSNEDSRAHHYVSVRFKSKEDKYGGSEEENLSEHVDEYLSVTRDYNLTQTQKLQYLHNLFKGEALRFYNKQVREKESTIGGAINAMQNHFNSLDKQQRVKADLTTLSLSAFSEKHGGSIRKGLAKMASYIAERTPLCPPDFRGESHQIEFMKQAVLEYPWAEPILYRINQNTEFQQFYTELANALQLSEEKAARKSESSHHKESSSKPLILFNQPKYAKKITQSLFPGYNIDKSCWNCGSPQHTLNRCTKPINTSRVAARKVQFYEKKFKGKNRNDTAKQVLYELVRGLDELLNIDGSDASGDDNDAETYFESTLLDYSSDDETKSMTDSKVLITNSFNEQNCNEDTALDDSDF